VSRCATFGDRVILLGDSDEFGKYAYAFEWTETFGRELDVGNSTLGVIVDRTAFSVRRSTVLRLTDSVWPCCVSML
jgi:hypothetical protein